MTEEPQAPEYHTQTLSPLSPLPVHVPTPSLPVLQNQIDPICNMISTHEPPQLQAALVAKSAEVADADPNVASPSAESNFSDAYKEADNEEPKQDGNTKQGSDVSDDYAMTFDSDGEAHADIQDVQDTILESEAKASSYIVSKPVEPSLSSKSADSSPNSPANEIPQSKPSPSPTANAEPQAVPTENVTTETQVDSSEAKPLIHDDVSSGDIDIQQLLDNITANAERKDAENAAQTANAIVPVSTNGTSVPAHSSLPPRPNLPQKRPYDDIQKYHNVSPTYAQSPNSFAPPSLVAAGAPGTSVDPRSGLPPPGRALHFSSDPRGGLPPPPSATFPNPLSNPSYTQNNRWPVQGNQTASIGSEDVADDLDAKWGKDIQEKYDSFLEAERHFVTEGLWDQFPNGSRLFIGNLSSEKVTKRDIFHVFHQYGKIAQISIKQAYGFVQFYDTASCHLALKREQGAEVREKKIHLEVSKPQKNTRNAQAATTRRSRSPDRSRNGGRNGRSRQGQGDRYEPTRAAPQTRLDEYGRPLRIRDDYRPQRSPSPSRGNFRDRDDYGRSRESYNDWNNGRDRQRSRSPYGQRDVRYRDRSPSPRSREAEEDASLQIPRREARDVPDVQIILMDQLDRAFISWVENELRGRGLKVDVLFLSPRFPLQAVTRRQIIEGVLAVAKLDNRSQQVSKIPLQLFHRSGGITNVTFEEYADLEPRIAAELVLRAKQPPVQQNPQQTQPPYAPPQYGHVQPYQQPAAMSAPDFSQMVGGLDNATIQKLLGSLAQQQQNLPAVNANSNIDLTRILGGLATQQPVPQPAYQPQPDPYANLAANPAIAALLANSGMQQQAPAPAPQQSAQQVQNIMAQLARFRQ